MPGLIIPNIFSLFVHQQWVVAGALAAVTHAQDSVRQEESCWLVESQTVISQGEEPWRGPDTKRMMIKMRVSRLQQHLRDAWQTKWAAYMTKRIMRNIYLHNEFIFTC